MPWTCLWKTFSYLRMEALRQGRHRTGNPHTSLGIPRGIAFTEPYNSSLPQHSQITNDLTMILNNTDKLVILLAVGLTLYFYSKNKRSSLPLPPGPKKLPLLGNLLDFPTSHQWLQYIEWGKQFSRFPVLPYHLHNKLIGWSSDRLKYPASVCCWKWLHYRQFIWCGHWAGR